MSEPTNRPQRKRVGQKNMLKFESRVGFTRRIVNDVPGRIDMLKEAGWKVVENGKAVNERSNNVSGLGSATSRHVGGGVYGVLMEIPTPLYKEDQAGKETDLKAKERAMKSDAEAVGLKGSINIDR